MGERVKTLIRFVSSLLNGAIIVGLVYPFYHDMLNPWSSKPAEKTRLPVASGTATATDLAAHSKEFRKEIVEVADGLHVAVGYGLANVTILEGLTSLIVFDTLESREAAAALKEDIAKFSTKPIRHVIYTHNHADHVMGAGALVGDDLSQVTFYGHKDLAANVARVVGPLRPILHLRSMRQFGVYLPAADRPNAGIGPELKLDHRGLVDFVPPNVTFDKPKTELTIDGVRMTVLQAPGETDDTIEIYLPDQDAVIAADNFYKSFPNLYAIRGTKYRDVSSWVKSIDEMRALKAERLIPQHGRPVTGRDTVASVLTDYRDAIQYVHDQTIRWMNKGLVPDEIVKRVALPPHLANNPYLQPFYGRVDWSVREIFQGNLGWFSGDAADLFPPSTADIRSAFTAVEAGKTTLQAAEDALEENPALSLWLARVIGPDNPEASKALRIKSLRKMAEKQPSAAGRNYLLTQAQEADGFVIPPSVTNAVPQRMLEATPIGNYMSAMPVALKAEEVLDKDVIVAFRFTDVGENYVMHIRRGVAALSKVDSLDDVEAAATVSCASLLWKQILARQTSAALSVVGGSLTIEGDKGLFQQFVGWFEGARKE